MTCVSCEDKSEMKVGPFSGRAYRGYCVQGIETAGDEEPEGVREACATTEGELPTG
jgi:hypothetical protein